MSAGYIQLTALGQQDVWLTGEPQVTYFSGVYRRHTPFVLEAFEVPFLGQTVKYGSKSICRIPPKGDLVRGLTLGITLPQLTNTFGLTNWYWPIIPSSSNTAQFVVNSVSSAPIVGPYSITWYSTYNATADGTDQWLSSAAGGNGPLSNWVRYDVSSNRFIFGNYNGGTLSSIWVRTTKNDGIFWGLDPLAATSTATYGGYTWLGYSVTNNRLFPQFSLEQAGWYTQPTQGLPPAASRSGLYLQAAYPINIGTKALINFADPYSLTSDYWTNWDTSSSYTITPTGRINFTTPGIYIMKVGFGLVSGSISKVSWGQVAGVEPLGQNPVFSGSYEWRVSPNPSSPTIFPLNITDTNSNVYVYAYGTGATISAGSYLTISQADDYFLFSKNVIPLVDTTLSIDISNTYSTGSTTTTKLNDGSFTWRMAYLGTYIISSVVSMSNGYVSSATLSEGSNTVYVYDMSSQGRNPTFAFTLPLVVSDTARKYSMKLARSNTTANVDAGSYFIFSQVGIPSTSSGTQGVLSYSGLTFQPESTAVVSTSDIFTTPLSISSTNFVSNGYSYHSDGTGGVITAQDTSNLVFSTYGTYVLTGTLCTADQVTSISINTWSINGNTVTTYPVGLGLLPPYTFNIPFRISNAASSNTTILATVNGTTARPNIFSNTFISVYPLAVSIGAVQLSFPYYDSVGTLAVVSAELKIGGQTIQSLTGEAIEIWNDLNVPYENQPALKLLTGKGDTSNIISSRTYYVNLPFYFFGSPELSIPICALDRQDMEVHVTFNNFSKLTSINSSINASLATPSLASSIIVEYVYLSDPEINWFRRSRVEQVILQYQYLTIPLPINFSSGVFKLNFNNPVRELFFVIQNDSKLPNNPYDYTESGLQSIGLSFNGYDAFTPTTADATYMGTIEPFNHYINFPTRYFNMYCFCTNPGSINPNGFVNFSRINDILMTLNLTPSTIYTRTCRVTAVNYNVLRIENGLAGLAFSSS